MKLKKIRALILITSLLPIGLFISLYAYNWIKYQKAIWLLRKGQAEYVVEGHRNISFKFLNGEKISVENLPLAPFGDVWKVIKKCREPCKNTGFWME